MDENPPLEWAFAHEIINRWIDKTYEVCNNHIRHDRDQSNKFPCFRKDIWDLLGDKELPDDSDLWQRVHDKWNEDLEMDSDYFRDNFGFEIFQDCNGYRVLADIPIVDLMDRLDEYEIGLKELRQEDDPEDPPDPEVIEEMIKEIQEIYKELIKCAGQLAEFEKFKQSLDENNYFDDYVVIDYEGTLLFEHKEHFEDFKEEHGWKLYCEEETENAVLLH